MPCHGASDKSPMTEQLHLLTPCLNAAATIDRTIWGVVSQEGGVAIRYHVQDGGSTDGTLEKLSAWRERIGRMRDELPSRVEFTFDSRPDRGMYEAILRGFEMMRTPAEAMMGWCNADDVLWQGSLAHVARVGREFPETRWLTGWSTSFDERLRFNWLEKNTFFPRQVLAAGLANGRHWPHLQQESTFWRKGLWDKVGGVDPSFRLAGDWDLWRRFAQHEELVHVDRQLGAFYFREGQKSADVSAYQAECEARCPMPSRLKAYRGLVSAAPRMETLRIGPGEGGALRRRLLCLDSSLSESLRLNLLPAMSYFRKLRRRGMAACQASAN